MGQRNEAEVGRGSDGVVIMLEVGEGFEPSMPLLA